MHHFSSSVSYSTLGPKKTGARQSLWEGVTLLTDDDGGGELLQISFAMVPFWFSREIGFLPSLRVLLDKIHSAS